jgi:Reverse transcriptase (RNA-dependent DNA polymerase)/Zinc knuckle
MPKTKTVEAAKEPEICILKMGKNNNVILWKESMYNMATELFGEVGTYFYTNVAYRYPFPHEREYNPFFVEPALVGPAEGPEEEGEANENGEENEADAAEPEPEPVLPDETVLALVNKLRLGAYEARRKRQDLAILSLRRMWGKTWARMSIQSQSKVREDPDFERAFTELDSIALWTFIRKTHLTHIYGEDDEMSAVNIHDQSMRYHNLRQGDKEYISDFKVRFDNQVKCNQGVGIPDTSEALRAIDFIGKLDHKRYNGMLTSMRNCACQNLPGSYPKTLAAAYRTASTWTRDGLLTPLGGDTHSAFLADTAFVLSKGKDKDSKPPGEKKEKRSSSHGLGCFVCGKIGHVARECSLRKTPDVALMVSKLSADGDEPDIDRYGLESDDEAVYLTAEETVLLSIDEVVFDNASTIHLIKNAKLLTEISSTDRPIVVNGVQANAAGVRVDMVGILGDIGEVYYSRNASANILSMSGLVDSGAKVIYDQKRNRFTVQPKGSRNIYSFCRKNITGSENKFYVCDMKTMISNVPTTHPIVEDSLVTTVEHNMKKFTKREVIGARKARELLAKLGYPSVENAIAMLRDGTGFDVTPYDFQVADSIWGPDIASMIGKTTKAKSMVPDATLGAPILQQHQILVFDIMFIDQVSMLVAVAYPLDLTFGVTLDKSISGKASRNAESVKKAIDIIISTLLARNFKATVIYSDGEGAMGKLKPQLNKMGLEVDISGAGGHVSRIERKIRVIKERVRAHISGRLPFALNILGLSMLILFCISRLNYQHSSTRPGGLTPREAFTGQRVAAEKDFRAAFGDSVIYTEPYTTSDMKSRIGQGIVYLPSGNRSGSVKCLNILTGAIVTRDTFKIVPTTTAIIKIMNDMAALDGRFMPKHSPVIHDITYNQSVNKTNMPPFISVQPPLRDIGALALIPDNPHPIAPPVLADTPPVDVTEINEIIPHNEGGGNVVPVPLELAMRENHVHFEDDPVPVEPVYEEEPPVHTPPVDDDPPVTEYEPVTEEALVPADTPHPDETHSEQTSAVETAPVGSPVRPSTPQTHRHFTRLQQRRITDRVLTTSTVRAATGGGEKLVLSGSAVESITRVLEQRKREGVVDPSANVSVKQALKTRGAEAEQVIIKELTQMEVMKVWEVVHADKLKPEHRSGVIRSSMFLKRKTHPDGSFDKYKARLVAGGDQQDKTLYDDLSSPTVSTSSVFTIIAIAAHEKRHAAVVDIGSAFLNAEMSKGVPVYMRLDKIMSEFLVKINPKYSGYRDRNGTITVLLKKALYGCVESAALSYENLNVSLKGLGYVRNEIDICVYNKAGKDGVQCTLCIHVDDLLITSSSKPMIEHITQGLKSRYGVISLKHGPNLNYLGMSLDFTHSGEARVTMAGYVDEVLRSSGVTGTARTPASDTLFETGESVLVSEEVRVWFHRVVAQLLYLAKRVRPECLTAVAYLATRVTKCDSYDVEKLHRLVRYIRGTADLGLVLRPGVRGIVVRLYVNASYGVHRDGKSHTGSCVVIGDVGAVHCRSTKQGIVAKSSTEAELIGLSDSANQGLHMRNFLVMQGYKMPAVIIYQDNLSCMALIARGRSGAERTRHVAIRYFWTKERVDSGELKMVHKGTKDMYANVLTKPLQGSQFVHERRCLTGWEMPFGAK